VIPSVIKRKELQPLADLASITGWPLLGIIVVEGWRFQAAGRQPEPPPPERPPTGFAGHPTGFAAHPTERRERK
jgi:hypothetical protein